MILIKIKKEANMITRHSKQKMDWWSSNKISEAPVKDYEAL
jgi:hypothetical protein